MGALKDPALIIGDIIAEIEFLASALDGRAADALATDPILFRAIQYSVLSLGEAAKRLPEEVRARHPQIPWRDMTRTRDFLAHGYDRVTPSVLWRAIHDDILPLRNVVSTARDEERERRTA